MHGFEHSQARKNIQLICNRHTGKCAKVTVGRIRTPANTARGLILGQIWQIGNSIMILEVTYSRK